MSFDLAKHGRPRVAIIGGGISGMAAAYDLADTHNVTLFEAAPRLGGHARTVMAGRNGDQPVDTGFIVFNYANYPLLTRMFMDLDVPVERSDMSFGATVDGGRVEYGLQSVPALFGQGRNLVRPGFWRMVRDILRFNAQAERVAQGEDMTVGDLIDQLGLGKWFAQYYLLPICGAIWSTPPQGIRAFPARALVQFFRNHALLSATGQHQWWTVSGGSQEYVRRLETNITLRGAQIRLNTPVNKVVRMSGAVQVDGETFDHVILACHSDQALRLLADANLAEREALGAIKYQPNQMVLHRDAGQMPRRRACWSSWVYQAKTDQSASGIGVTYWMNKLQNIPENDPLFVTLNPIEPIDPTLIYDQKSFDHPVFDGPALRAQAQIDRIQGQNNTWFAGAYLRHGFHEDGFASARRISRVMNARARDLEQVAAQ